MNRFVTGENKKGGTKALWSVLAFAIIATLFWCALTSISSSSSEQRLNNLENALNRDITHHYATEGRYPDDLEELKNDYRLSWDEDEIFVGYRSMGANIFPDVTIISCEENR